MFWAMTVPAALFFIFSFILPESPRWLASSGHKEAAFKVFSRMGGRDYARQELEAIAMASSDSEQQGGFKQLLRPAMRKVLIIGVVMAVLQQWCGINVIFNYAQEIFMAAGYGVSDVLMNIVVTGITNVIFTILAMFVVKKNRNLKSIKMNKLKRIALTLAITALVACGPGQKQSNFSSSSMRTTETENVLFINSLF